MAVFNIFFSSQPSHMSNPRKRFLSFLGSVVPAFSEGSFARNLSFVSGTNLVTITAQLVFTPIIVKLYSPEAYGAFGFIISSSSLALSLSTLRYENALLLTSNEDELRNLRAVSVGLPFCLSLILTATFIPWHHRLLALANVKNIGYGIFLIPLLLTIRAWAQATQRMVAVRYKYKQNFIFGSGVVVGSKLVAILYGVLLGSHYWGLILSELFGNLTRQVINAKVILKEKLLRFKDLPSWARMKEVMRKYDGFPKYELPATGLSAISNQVPLFWIPRSYSLAQFGQFSLALSLLEMPMRLLGYSITTTFYQKAARTYEEQGGAALALITFRMMAGIAALSFVPLLLIAIFVEPVLNFIFGSEWALTGAFSSALSLFYFFRLVVEPVISVLRVIGDQRAYLWFNAGLLMLRIIAVGISVYFNYGIVLAIYTYSIMSALGYIAQGAYLTIKMRGLQRNDSQRL